MVVLGLILGVVVAVVVAAQGCGEHHPNKRGPVSSLIQP